MISVRFDFTQIFSSYITEKAARIQTKDQSVNVFEGNNRYLVSVRLK
jgi:hypothetical protein